MNHEGMFDNTSYYEGKQGFREGWTREENPYGYGSPDFDAWLAGWDDASGE